MMKKKNNKKNRTDTRTKCIILVESLSFIYHFMLFIFNGIDCILLL